MIHGDAMRRYKKEWKAFLFKMTRIGVLELSIFPHGGISKEEDKLHQKPG